MSDKLTISATEPNAGELVRNALVLGAIYAAAIICAVAFSPNMGFFSHPDSPPASHAPGKEIASRR